MNSMTSSGVNSHANVESTLNSSITSIGGSGIGGTNAIVGGGNNYARGISSRKVQIPLFKPRAPNSAGDNGGGKEVQSQQYIDSMFGVGESEL